MSIFSNHPRTYKALKESIPSKHRIKEFLYPYNDFHRVMLQYVVHDYCDPTYEIKTTVECVSKHETSYVTISGGHEYAPMVNVTKEFNDFVNGRCSRSVMINSIFLKIIQAELAFD